MNLPRLEYTGTCSPAVNVLSGDLDLSTSLLYTHKCPAASRRSSFFLSTSIGCPPSAGLFSWVPTLPAVGSTAGLSGALFMSAFSFMWCRVRVSNLWFHFRGSTPIVAQRRLHIGGYTSAHDTVRQFLFGKPPMLPLTHTNHLPLRLPQLFSGEKNTLEEHW